MKLTSLSELSLLYVDSMDFDDNCFSLKIKAGNGQQKFLVILQHIISFLHSKDPTEEEVDYEVNILELQHEYRHLVSSDFHLISFVLDESRLMDYPEFHVIHIEASGKVIDIICKDLEVSTF
jgi:hypothetical protein